LNSVSMVDPEEFDASEQTFAASLEPAAAPRSRFVVDMAEPEVKAPASDIHGESSAGVLTISEEETVAASAEPVRIEPVTQALTAAETASNPVAAKENLKGAKPEIEPPATDQAVLPGSQDPSAWRQEVSAKLGSYQARRGAQESRYPSLHLKFDSEPISGKDAPGTATQSSLALDGGPPASAGPKRMPASAPAIEEAEDDSENATRVIRFPRSSAVAPPRRLDELAEPVFDRPRILEAPEVPPPPPALGGMLIETVEEPKLERRPGFEIPLCPASMSLRMFAAGMDVALVTFAVVLFEYIFFQLTESTMPALEAVAIGVAFGIVFWAGYQFLLLAYAGTTPGLRLASLRLCRFDDTPASRHSRQWRALASIMSLLSLGLGYAWCFLDEDQLCWHDRITGTYLSAVDPPDA